MRTEARANKGLFSLPWVGSVSIELMSLVKLLKFIQ